MIVITDHSHDHGDFSHIFMVIIVMMIVITVIIMVVVVMIVMIDDGYDGLI